MSASPKTVKPRPIRSGDYCRIVVPEFVVRVGYPLTVDAEADKILASYRADLMNTVVRLGGGYGSGPKLEKAVRRMAREIAYLRCVGQGWGGKERAIYRHRIEEYAGREFHVRGVRFVKTGTYDPPRQWAEDDYSPARLLDEKAHRILELPYCPPAGTPLPTFSFLEIEAANVERIEG